MGYKGKLLVVNFILISFISFSQNSNELKILNVLNEQTVSWNKGDIEGFMDGYWKSDELTFIGKNGITKGWNNVIENYRKSYKDKNGMGKLSFSQLTVSKLSNNCYRVTGAWQLKKDNPSGGWFTLIFKKIKKNWRIVYDHSS